MLHVKFNENLIPTALGLSNRGVFLSRYLQKIIPKPKKDIMEKKFKFSIIGTKLSMVLFTFFE